jgi:hypothetical protein
VSRQTDTEGRFKLPVLDGFKGTLHGYMYATEGEYVNCPKLDQLIRAYKDLETNRIKLEANKDQEDIELVFPFPYCAKTKKAK